jgi:hypothetical protein
MELTENEVLLLGYFRSMSEFNRRRILVSAATAADAFKRTQQYKALQK